MWNKLFRKNKVGHKPSIVFADTLQQFLSSAQDRNSDGAVFVGYQEPQEVSDYTDTLDARAIRIICPTFGQVSLSNGNFQGIVVDDKKTLTPPLRTAVIELATIFHLAEAVDEVRFTLASIHSGSAHAHLQTYMTYPFINVGTEFHEVSGPPKKPCLFKRNIEHWSPKIEKGQNRMLCTFFPATNDLF